MATTQSSQLTNLTPTTDVARVQRILAGQEDVAAAEIVKLEKECARAGKREMARALHAYRLAKDTKRANEILSGGNAGIDPAELLDMAKRLAGDKSIGLARRLLNEARVDLNRTAHGKVYVKIFQKCALYTYKDVDLPADWRLNRALEILGEGDDLSSTKDPESLGLAGAIYKRKWEIDSERGHLERALFYYLKGYALGAPEKERDDVLAYLQQDPTRTLNAEDQGYTGINAAFILDLLADQEEEEAARVGMKAATSALRRMNARLIRQEIIRSVPALLAKPGNDWLKEEWWFYATIGEAHFGLGVHDPSHYKDALDWLVDRPRQAGLERAAGTTSTGALDIPEWEYESTARQLARLARLQGPDPSEAEFEASDAGQALARFLQNDHEAVRSAFRGKFGLALSGGGFRASLFHIGVMASLAEHGVLGHVEALSCVSGGSIIGAHYYLELRRLLQTKADADILPNDYVDIVRQLEDKFLKGVQRNIRMRVLSEWTTNLRMIFVPGYSRTLRVGELYERELFRHVDDGGFTGPTWMPDWMAQRFGHKRKRYLNALRIEPKSASKTPNGDVTFEPRNHNWRRVNKVPVLVLNATTLNTGHCWQFTASFMGEPPGRINTEIDANDRLRRMYYPDAPKKHRQIRLGHAVAASSCVPGLFEPLMLDKLYPDRSVRLVDGGVCDNQGVSSLLEQDCTVALVSDASGQMASEARPSSSVVGVPLRANSVLQARVREAQYSEVSTRKRSRLLQGLMFLHLKKDLVVEPVPWVDIPSDLRTSDFAPQRTPDQDATSYGVSGAIQGKLAAVRTDLDSFSDVEAFALMASGYRMANAQFLSNPDFREFKPVVANGKWQFKAVDRAMQPRRVEPTVEAQRSRLAMILDASASVAFKIWKLSRVLRFVKVGLAVIAVAAVAWLLYASRETPILQVLPSAVTGYSFGALGKWIAFTVLAYVLGRALGERYGHAVMKAIQWRETLRSVLIGIGLAAGGFLIARLHLHVFDRWYLRAGSMKRFSKLAP